jgi:uncharacterized membrane protein HdeD (DUF308 family)
MSAGAGHNWWAIGLRGGAAILFAITILSLPPQAVAPLVFLFAAYLTADGALPILAGMRAPRWGYRWPMSVSSARRGVCQCGVSEGEVA